MALKGLVWPVQATPGPRRLYPGSQENAYALRVLPLSVSLWQQMQA